MRDIVFATSTNEQDVSPKQSQQYKHKHTPGAHTPTKFQQNEHTPEFLVANIVKHVTLLSAHILSSHVFG